MGTITLKNIRVMIFPNITPNPMQGVCRHLVTGECPYCKECEGGK
jgi:hypothetical protein